MLSAGFLYTVKQLYLNPCSFSPRHYSKSKTMHHRIATRHTKHFWLTPSDLLGHVSTASIATVSFYCKRGLFKILWLVGQFPQPSALLKCLPPKPMTLPRRLSSQLWLKVPTLLRYNRFRFFFFFLMWEKN